VSIGKKATFSMSRVSRIGVIAEDTTDYHAIRILTQRIIGAHQIGFRSKNANGCTKIRSKSATWAIDLKRRGCDMLLIVHDQDDRNYDDLKAELNTKLKSSPIPNYYVCIPVEEIEAWFLADGAAVKKALGLKRAPKIKGFPETIKSPKEFLHSQIAHCSDNEIYFSPAQNQLIAEHVNIDTLISRCPSFRDFHTFVSSHDYR